MARKSVPLTDEQRRLVEQNFRCAVLFAGRKCFCRADPDTVFEAAMYGLMSAARTYDGREGASFDTYAWTSMSMAVRRARLADRLVHVPETFWSPKHKGMNDRDHESAQGVMKFIRIGHQAKDEWDVAEDQSDDDGDDWVAEAAGLRDAIAGLPTRQRIVLRARLRGLSLTTIGAGLDLSRQRVSQIEQEAMWSLRWRLQCAG